MLRRWLWVLVLLALPRPAWGKGDLYILGITLNQQPDPARGVTMASYNWCAEEINKLFRAQARSFHRRIQTRLVQAQKATRAGALGGLAWLRQKATRMDLVVMYVGAHGTMDPAQGWRIETSDRQTLWGHEIKRELGRLPCSVLLLIETCTSGGFAARHKNDLPVPRNVTAICACSGKQTTSNQLDMAVAEALYGRADFNKNGTVTLDELIRYVKLRYKEWWPAPKTTLNSQTHVIVRAKTMHGALPLTKVSRRLVGVVHSGTWYSALLEGQSGGRYRVHLLGWSSRPGEQYFLTNVVSREFICLRADRRPLLVKQNGRWYPARLLRKVGANFQVHYLGYRENEVVPKSRVYYPFVGRPKGRSYLALITTEGAGTWVQLGSAGAWRGTRVGAVLKNKLYTVETNGYLYRTDLLTGTWTQVGKGEFGATAYLFAAGGSLYTIEKDGNLYRVDPKSGRWNRVGPAGAWKNTRAGAILQGQLYTVEAEGGLYVTNLGKGTWKQVGKAEFGNTAFLFAAGGKLYTIEKDGSLYRVNPNDGAWVRLGRAGEWKGTLGGVGRKGRLYTVEANGGLWATALGTGKWKQVGKKMEFGNTMFLFAALGRLYSIEKNASLYGVGAK
jgi:hypothetical protein